MVGETISHYKILSELGRGGIGVVYKAEDTKLERRIEAKSTPGDASVFTVVLPVNSVP